MEHTTKCGLVYGGDEHHLDHIAPLCHLLSMPLVVSTKEMERLARHFYPEAEVVLAHTVQYDLVYSCLPRPMLESAFFAQIHLLKKPFRSVWVPHGHSDKGGLAGLKEETALLVYGRRMEEEVRAAKIDATLTRVGNFRYTYYQKMRSFYDQMIALDKPAILFAPSWNDQEGPSSLFTALPHLVNRLEDKWTLLVKPHPNLLKQEPLRFEEAVERYAGEQVVFLKQFPPIYPLLAKVERYVGDTSSIGYDMLAFGKPMFFLNHKKQNLFLHKAGHVLREGEYDPIFATDTPPIDTIQEMRALTFGETV